MSSLPESVGSCSAGTPDIEATLNEPPRTINMAAPPYCKGCGKLESQLPVGQKLLYCAKCKTTKYCSKACQKADWSIHNKQCLTFGEQLVRKVVQQPFQGQGESLGSIPKPVQKSKAEKKDPIGHYLSSLNASELAKDTGITSIRLAEDVEMEHWSLHKVKKYLSEGASSTVGYPIICTDMPLKPFHKQDMAAMCTDAISGYKTEWCSQIKVVYANRMFFGEHSAAYIIKSPEYKVWLKVLFGEVKVMAMFPKDSPDFKKWGPYNAAVLTENSKAFMPKCDEVMFYFSGEKGAMVLMGQLVYRLNDNEGQHRSSADQAKETMKKASKELNIDPKKYDHIIKFPNTDMYAMAAKFAP